MQFFLNQRKHVNKPIKNKKKESRINIFLAEMIMIMIMNQRFFFLQHATTGFVQEVCNEIKNHLIVSLNETKLGEPSTRPHSCTTTQQPTIYL